MRPTAQEEIHADLPRIHSVGMGAIQASSEEHAKLRRVTVRLQVTPD